MWSKMNFDLGVGALIPVALATQVFLAQRSGLEATRNAVSAKSCENNEANRVITAAAARHLERHGYVIIHGAQSGTALASSIKGATNMKFETPLNDSSVRQDRITWIESCNDQNLKQAVSLLKGIAHALALNNYQQKGELIVPQSCQLSCYPPDGKASYMAHRDAPASDFHSFYTLGLMAYLRNGDCRQRRLTCILYLNPPRQSLAGGHLQFFLGAENSDDYGYTASSVLHVEPRGGDLIIFDSIHMLHAVLPTTQQRFALTTWLHAPLPPSPLSSFLSSSFFSSSNFHFNKNK